jgi:FHA domain/Bacterial regulatory proteins, luxR family
MSDFAQPPGSLHSSSPAELLSRIEAERSGMPFLEYRDGSGGQRIVRLDDSASPVTVGRAVGSAVHIDWDANVSRVHAQLVQVGEEWALADDGLSRNGSYVNGERVTGRRRLRDGDVLRVGDTAIIYRAPLQHAHDSTAVAGSLPATSDLSPAQRRVLVALARPFHNARGFATPATNQEIAQELYLSVDAVKTHLRALFEKFGVRELPQNQKRARLVERAFTAGVITERELAQDRAD